MAAPDLIISADFGTSGVKIGVVTGEMRLLASTVEPYPLALPGPNQAEQSPEDWWGALARGLARLGAQVPQMRARTGGLVFCAQMAGLVCADAKGTPLRPALVWLDKRAAPLTARIIGGWPRIQGYGVGMLARWLPVANGAPSRNGMDPIAKMLWVKTHEPEIFAASHKCLDVKDWLVHRATGAFATTADCANLTWLMDSRPGREGWSPALARRIGMPLEKLPEIVDGGHVVGGLTAAAAAQLGLAADIPVFGGGGDVTATALGSGAVEDGALHLCLSTSSWVSGFWGRRVLSVQNAFGTIASSLGNRPLLIATQESAGAALQWLAEGFDPKSPGTGEGFGSFYDGIGASKPDDPFFMPWLAGERVPVDDARLRGAFVGLALNHDLPAVKRSVIEGVAFNTRWAFEKVTALRDARASDTVPLVGGAAQNPLLAQALADALNCQVRVGHARMSGVLGAAAMAAPGLGWADSPWDAARAVGEREGPVYDPDPAQVARLNDRYARLARLRHGLVKSYRQGEAE